MPNGQLELSVLCLDFLLYTVAGVSILLNGFTVPHVFLFLRLISFWAFLLIFSYGIIFSIMFLVTSFFH